MITPPLCGFPVSRECPPPSLGFAFQSSERFRPTSLVVLVVNSGNDEDDGNVGDMDFEEEKTAKMHKMFDQP